jgi:hypothetical protein
VLKMRRAVITLAIAIVLALDWAALDDITTGIEPSFVGEYATLIASVPAVGILWRWVRPARAGEPRPD